MQVLSELNMEIAHQSAYLEYTGGISLNAAWLSVIPVCAE